MFPKKQRLHTTKDILTVFRHGEVIRCGFLKIYILPAKELLVTVIIDKKVSKLAVERNIIKRRLREILQKQQLSPAKYVVRGYSGIEKLAYQQLDEMIQKCLNKNPKNR